MAAEPDAGGDPAAFGASVADGLCASRAGAEMYDLAVRLWPLPRSLTGAAFRQTLDALAEVTGPMIRHRVRSGTTVLDWTVPDEWNIRDGWIKDPDGQKVVDFAASNLHVLGYSTPIQTRLSLEELQPHLFSLPEQPEAVPYLTSYYQRRWGFCLSQRKRDALRPGTYEVLIDADLAPGHLDYGEVRIEGESDDEVLFSTYCCHPSLANNELSGPLVVSHLARLVRGAVHRPRLSYTFLFLPETIGAIAYLAEHGDRLKGRLVAGYVVTCVGDPGPFTYRVSRRGATLADRTALHVLRHLSLEYTIEPFIPNGSDERQYCSPGFDLPVGSLMRTMYGRYPEYHTSLDDLTLITPEALGDSVAAYAAIVDVLEAAATFETMVPYGEPQLGARGLYPTLGSQRSTAEQVLALLSVLNFSDGRHDLLAIADRIGRPVWELRPVAETLLSHGLLRRCAG